MEMTCFPSSDGDESDCSQSGRTAVSLLHSHFWSTNSDLLDRTLLEFIMCNIFSGLIELGLYEVLLFDYFVEINSHNNIN